MMKSRGRGFVGVAAVGFVLLCAQLATAQRGEQALRPGSTHAGQVERVAENTLTMTTNGEDSHQHKVTNETEVIIDGRQAELQDLQKGDRIRVTMGQSNVASRIEATRQGDAKRQPGQQGQAQPRQPGQVQPGQPGQKSFRAGSTHTGEIVSVGENSITESDGEDQHQHRVAAETEITIDGRKAELDDLRRGDRIRVTMGENNVAARIEATRQRQEFPGERRGERERAADPEREGQAALGVALAPSRGAGVLISDVAPQSPAEQAGLRPGDYLLELDNQEVSSPDEVMELLDQKRPGQQLDLIVWRAGREMQQRATLVSSDRLAAFRPEDEPRARDPRREVREGEQRDPRAGDDAWLGILLGRATERGIEVERVYPDAPADRAGLREGDIVVEVDGQPTTSPEEISDALDRLQPNQEVRIQVRRNGQQQTITATVGSRRRFMEQRRLGDDRFFAAPDGQPFGAQDPAMFQPPRQLVEQNERIERALRELLREVQQLRQEVQRQQSPQQSPQQQRPLQR